MNTGVLEEPHPVRRIALRSERLNVGLGWAAVINRTPIKDFEQGNMLGKGKKYLAI